jgi:hypothetical protein
MTTQAKQGLAVPLAHNYYTQLTDIDYHLAQTSYPMNVAMKLAIEMVMTHFHYTDPGITVIKNVS